MTISEALSGTKNDELNIALAEWSGWKDAGPPGMADPKYKRWSSPNGTAWDFTPSYTSDLNACHEAEEHLTGRQQFAYYYQLTKICQGMLVHRATALQRTVSLLMVVKPDFITTP